MSESNKFSSYITPKKRQSNFQKILEFNEAFGVKTNTTIQHDIFDKDPKLVQYRLSLIEEEVDELKQAIEMGKKACEKIHEVQVKTLKEIK